MYKKILVPVDNSDHSSAAVEIAVAVARAFGASLVGSHAYAAKLHDIRFKQMEYTLPDEYLEERELERQRKIHDSLITLGLRLVSDCYIDPLLKKAAEAGVAASARTYDGRNFQVIVDDLRSGDCDLVVLGALGMGATRDSQLGSVCERVVRRVRVDTLVVKDVRPLAEQTGAIIVGVDGSPQSFAGLLTALELGKALARPVEAVAVYDPYLHYTVFNGVVKVLDEKASKIFRFKEQEKLHEEIIDTGLAKIYQSHLQVAKALAADKGVDLKTTLLDGKAFDRVLQYVRREKPWLLVLGRIGVHSDDEMDIGSNTENLLRLANVNVLLSSGKHVPATDVKAAASIVWTDEAKKRMERVPVHVRGIAQTAIHRYAMERGHSVVTNVVIDGAVGAILPEGAVRAMGISAERIALARASFGDEATWICDHCGHSVRGERPATCSVCEGPGERFTSVDRRAIETLSPLEGGLEEEEAFDGVKLKWTTEARLALGRIENGYDRRRLKARLEKTARVRRLEVITKEEVERGSGDLADEPAVSGGGAKAGAAGVGAAAAAASASAGTSSSAATAAAPTAVDPAGGGGAGTGSGAVCPFAVAKSHAGAKAGASVAAPATATAAAAAEVTGTVSGLVWDDDARARLERVPQGFMRDITRDRAEALAGVSAAAAASAAGAAGTATHVTLATVEESIRRGLEEMKAMVSGQRPNGDAQSRPPATP
ncbi:MAG: universal stress protein [Planctomycetes bacterium]|nr:universal stress protein [Planctomycetota bacterium]